MLPTKTFILLFAICCFCRTVWIQIKLFSKENKSTCSIFLYEYHQGVKQFGSSSDPTLCKPWSGYKLFGKKQNQPLHKIPQEYHLSFLDADQAEHNVWSDLGTNYFQKKKYFFFWKIFQKYHQSVKKFGYQSSPTLHLAWSGS